MRQGQGRVQRFNLLPHQAMHRHWAIRVLSRQILTTSLLGVLGILLAMKIQEYRIDFAEAYNRTLAEGIHAQMPDYSKAQRLLIERASLLEKKTVLESVDARRTSSVQIMADLVGGRPAGLYFTKLEENGESLRIEGRSISSEAIAGFFENIGASRHIRDLVLEEIQILERVEKSDENTGRLYGFVIHGQVNLAALLPRPLKRTE